MSNDKEQKKEGWRLDKIELEFETYGEHKGKYVGSIRFQNGEYESFNFKFYPGMANQYITLIAQDLVKCAAELADNLIKSLTKQGLIDESV